RGAPVLEHLSGDVVRIHPSFTNFVLIEFESSDAAHSSDAVLRAEGLLMRGMSGYNLAHCLRMTIAAEDLMEQAATALWRWQKGGDREWR
ncbi:MAG: hypothetical protein AAF317_18045, partial [Pseudomonadota bacterium]